MKIKIFFICLILVFHLQADEFAKEDKPSQKKTICLNMIVKNESDVIKRCLESVKPLIDYWVIIDTGSTDGTQEVIKNFLKDVPGELHERPWVDFAFNRNEALALAKNKADYLFFIDADEILEYSDTFALPNLDKDIYYMILRQLMAADIKRATLVSNHLNCKWEGILHETLECPDAKSRALLTGILNVCNSGPRGGRSKDIKDLEKYFKDAQLLEKAIKKDPTNSRYFFYLGQSYLAAEKYELAKKNFEKRITMESSDIQETFMALYNIGLINEKLNDFDAAIQSFFKAYEYRRTRAEPLFRIAILYRKMGNYLLGYLLSKHALSIPYPAEDACIEYMTYDYALLIEFANCALLLGKYDEGLQACCKLMANPNLPANLKNQVLSNCDVATKGLLRATSSSNEYAPAR